MGLVSLETCVLVLALNKQRKGVGKGIIARYEHRLKAAQSTEQRLVGSVTSRLLFIFRHAALHYSDQSAPVWRVGWKEPLVWHQSVTYKSRRCAQVSGQTSYTLDIKDEMYSFHKGRCGNTKFKRTQQQPFSNWGQTLWCVFKELCGAIISLGKP